MTICHFNGKRIFFGQRLLAFTQAVFEYIGCSREDAALASKRLLSADLRGIDSRGIARMEAM